MGDRGDRWSIDDIVKYRIDDFLMLMIVMTQF